MELLGRSIGDILDEKKNFSESTILLLGEQMVECLEFLHHQNILHCDVKPDNFAISATNPRRIVIFDFGLACNVDSTVCDFRGSMLYASIDAHRLKKLTPKSDLQSLGFCLADFHKPLPWRAIDVILSIPKDPMSRITYFRELKQNTTLSDLSSNFSELHEYLSHVFMNDSPNYTKMKDIFRLIAN